MNLGQRLLELRKSKQLSQEEVAERLDVTRQTISKWETDQSTPDFDKIVPLCKLYGITTDELLIGKKLDDKNSSIKETVDVSDDRQFIQKKRAKGISIGVLLYFVALVWIMISIPVLIFNPIMASAIFLLICGIATYLIVYTCITYKISRKVDKKNKVLKQVEEVLSIITVITYLIISFTTMAWHITWIVWIVYALICEILKLIFMLKEDNKNE